MEIGEKKYRLTFLGNEKDVYKKNSLGYNQVRRMGRYKCECGEVIVVEKYLVEGKRGNTRSCGCLQKDYANRPKKHGRSKRHHKNYRTYSSWQHMKDRCLNPKNKYYKNYGGRGIKVCGRWMKFENFLEDMGDSPEGHSIDRLDINKGYSVDNCRWATKAEQNRNTSRTCNNK